MPDGQVAVPGLADGVAVLLNLGDQPLGVRRVRKANGSGQGHVVAQLQAGNGVQVQNGPGAFAVQRFNLVIGFPHARKPQPTDGSNEQGGQQH